MFRPMNIRPLARRALTSSSIALLAVLAFSGTASAANPIEGVWSFEHGAVDIQPLSNGTFQGTVVQETTFVRCPHAAGEVMWTQMREQPDGSFWGFHQWFEGTQCTPIAKLGQTAWRVLHTNTGTPFLRVCFTDPSDNSQPTIAPDGTYAGDSYGCVDSVFLEPSPGIKGSETETGTGSSGEGKAGSGSSPGSGSSSITFSKTVVLPSPTGCISQTSLKIALKDPKYDPLSEVVVKLNGKQVALVKGVKRLKKGITLKKLPTGTYKISVVATTVLKQQLSGSQTYKSCAKSSGKITLKKSKTHHHG
jgi:hypothetical protein